MKPMLLYIRDIISALWAWVSIWQINIEMIERRKRFINDVLDDNRKAMLPYKILMAAYNRKLKTNK